MAHHKKAHPKIKSQLHPRNKHRERYNFNELLKCCPELASFVVRNKYNDESINFFDPEAVKALNRALLKFHYSIDYWDIPKNYLCPPIPGRADYIHYMADLINSHSKTNRAKQIKCLDIGVGANCIYPILGFKEYGWAFVGSDINKNSVEWATKIVRSNAGLEDNIRLRLQANASQIFKGIIHPGEKFDVSICNPPFHGSAKEAQASALRKVTNLKGAKTSRPTLNFGGKQNELWCEGGERLFVQKMIVESRAFATACIWFSTLVSKETNLPLIYSNLKKVKALHVKTINMGQGNKKSRIVAWSFQ